MSETMIPLADLQDKFDDILKIVDETNEPVFLTKDGVPDLGLLSMEAYKKLRFFDLGLNKKNGPFLAKNPQKRFIFDKVGRFKSCHPHHLCSLPNENSVNCFFCAVFA